MTISGTTNRNQYTGNGATTVFARTFFVSDADHLKVFQTIGSTTTEVTSGITKDGIGSASGNVTFDTAPATGTTITLIREVPVAQETDYVAQGAVATEQVERDLDLVVQMIQDRLEEIGRTIKLPLSSGLSGLDLPVPFAGAAIGWNVSADGLSNISTLDATGIGTQFGTPDGIVTFDEDNTVLVDSAATIDEAGNMVIPGTLEVTGATTLAAVNVNGKLSVLTNDGTPLLIEGSAPALQFTDSDNGVDARINSDNSGSLAIRADSGNEQINSEIRFEVDGSQVGSIVAGGNVRFGDASSPSVTAEFAGTDAVLLPVGTAAQRPTGVKGQLRFNDDTDALEFYDGTTWQTLAVVV